MGECTGYMASLKVEIEGDWWLDNGSSFQVCNVSGKKDSCKREVLQHGICKLFALWRLWPGANAS